MLRFLAIRLLGGIATLLAASVLIFATVEFLPGDAASAYLGRDTTPAAAAKLRKEFGLDRPIAQRYIDWIVAVIHGDLGKSPANGVPVTTLVGDPIRNSAILVGITLLLLLPFSLFVGTVSALRRGSPIDGAVQVATLATVALPEFVVGIAFILVFAFIWRLLQPCFVSVVRGDADSSCRHAPGRLVRLHRAHGACRRDRRDGGGVRRHGALERPAGAIGDPASRPSQFPRPVRAGGAALTAALDAGGIIIIEALFGFPGMGVGLAIGGLGS